MYHPPPHDCPLCPRLCEFRAANRQKYPGYHNAPVPSFGGLEAPLLVVGLAPGLHGANQTGRPFTGDYAGKILYAALEKHGLARGEYDPEKVALQSRESRAESRVGAGGSAPDISHHRADGFTLINIRITNAVRCVPQENKPLPEEIRTCNAFLKAEIASMPNLKAILSLGLVSHNAVLRALGVKLSQYKFVHAAEHRIGSLTLLDSYHTSRYNINTGTLTEAMFDGIAAQLGQMAAAQRS